MVTQPPLRVSRLPTLPTLPSRHKPCLLTDTSRLHRSPTPAPIWKASFSPGNRLIHQKHTKDLPSRMCRNLPYAHPCQRHFVGVPHPPTLTEVPGVSMTVQWAYEYRRCLYFISLSASNELSSRLTGWDFADPCEFISSRVSRPKCAPTAELFGHLQSYSQHAHPSPREESDDGDDDHDEDTSAPDVLSPLKKRQREKLRESAGVKPKPTRKHTVGLPISKPKTALPPPGRMRCRWGDDCTVQMDFDYTFDTIKDWKTHIVSHLARPSETTEDSAGRDQKVKMVKCSWGGCSAKVERGYLFKHIITHEVRFKLLCPRGCEVAIRGDNLERHLRTCPLAG
jgi:hypothetical protein